MFGDDFLHAAGGKTVPSYIDDVISPSHDEEVAILIDISGIRSLIIAWEIGEVALAKALLRGPEVRQAAGRHGESDHDIAQRSRRAWITIIVQNSELTGRHRHTRRAIFHREHAQSQWVMADGRARFRLPPMVDHRHAQLAFSPLHRLRVSALARQEQGSET